MSNMTKFDYGMEPLLTVGEVAAFLRCSRAQVYRLVKEGSLAKAPLPYRATRFRRREVVSLTTGEFDVPGEEGGER